MDGRKRKRALQLLTKMRQERPDEYEKLEKWVDGLPERVDAPEDPRLTRILQAAEAHGEESEPAHEAGDLQAVLRECWTRMTPDARRGVYDSWMVQAIVTTWGPGETIEGEPG